MGLLSFVKEAGEKLFGKDDKEEIAREAQAKEQRENLMRLKMARRLEERVGSLDLKVENLKVTYDGTVARVEGRVPDQETSEKVALVVGNVQGVAAVDNDLEVERTEPEATFYTVKSGDTLSKIARDHYGQANKYMTIFEANRPMLKDPDKIYPGQVLRVPAAA